jgi:dihydroxycyclohexadiene carboxylate dehydrogenase
VEEALQCSCVISITVAVVTGAAQGIGREVALRLAREGAALLLTDRSEIVDETAAEARDLGAGAAVEIADAETFEGCERVMAAAVERFGRLDVLVNNVGGAIRFKPFAHFAAQEIEAEIRRSLFPTLWCCRAALPHLLEAGGGSIVNVSSVATRGLNRVPYAKSGAFRVQDTVTGPPAAKAARIRSSSRPQS